LKCNNVLSVKYYDNISDQTLTKAKKKAKLYNFSDY